MTRLLSDLIRWVSVVRGGGDADQFPLQQVQYYGKAADCFMVFPYGMHANVDGDSLAVMFAVGAAVDNRAAIPTSANRRAKLAPGEVTVYSPLTRSSVTFKANGDVIVDSVANITATAAGNITATAGGNITAAASGSLSATAGGGMSLTAPTIALNGAVTLTGGLQADSVTVSGVLSQGGKNVGATHTHSGVQTGGSNTGGVV